MFVFDAERLLCVCLFACLCVLFGCLQIAVYLRDLPKLLGIWVRRLGRQHCVATLCLFVIKRLVSVCVPPCNCSVSVSFSDCCVFWLVIGSYQCRFERVFTTFCDQCV